MNYELVKELKDAGFPFAQYRPKHQTTDPTLSELIEACGGGVLLWGCEFHGWYASEQLCPARHTLKDTIDAEPQGSTPEEAVARLWLALRLPRG